MQTLKKYEQVVLRLQTLIDGGTLKDGDKVPSIRSMARQMDLSMMTVLEGYRRLEVMGVIESRPKSGYYVRPRLLRESPDFFRLPEVPQVRVSQQTHAVEISEDVEMLFEMATRKGTIPLGAGIPCPEFLPSEELSIYMARVARTNPNRMNLYSLGKGELELRENIVRWMMRWGSHDSPDDIVVTNGATQGLLLALKAVTKPGDVVAVESPGYYGFFALCQFLGLKALEIPSDPQEGIAVEVLERSLGRKNAPSCVMLSSNFSNPAGGLIPDDRKKALAELAEKYHVPIIEDDTYGDLCFDDRRPKPLKAFSPDRVIYIGSFSKVLSPGYRVGWVSGGRHQEDIQRCQTIAVLASPMATQLSIAAYLEDGGMARHLKRLKRNYAETMRLMQTHVAEFFPEGTRCGNPKGGHFLWIQLPEGVDSVALAKRAAKKQISLAPGIMFSSRQNYRQMLRLNCAMEWSKRIVESLETVGKLAGDLK